MAVKGEKYKMYLIYLLIFLYMLLLNSKCGFLSDDYHFLFVWKDFMPTGNDKPIENIADIIESAKNYYNLSGGRIIPHFFAFIFVNIDKWIFNILNSAVFVLLGNIIYKYAFNKESRGAFCQAAVYISLFLFIPSFGDNVLWISGAVNYLWTGTLMLYCIYFCERHFDSHNIGTNAVMLFLVLLSSSTNEITGGMLAVWLTVYLLANKHKFNLKAVLFYILCTFGECLVVLAPGNANRAANIEEVQLFDLSKIGGLIFKYTSPFGFFICIIVITVLLVLKHERRKIKEYGDILPMLSAAAAGVCALCLTGFYTKRPIFFSVMITIAVIWKILRKFFKESVYETKKHFVVVMACTYILFSLLKLLNNILDLDVNYTFQPTAFALIVNYIYIYILTKNKQNDKRKAISRLINVKKAKIIASAIAIVFLGYSTFS